MVTSQYKTWLGNTERVAMRGEEHSPANRRVSFAIEAA